MFRLGPVCELADNYHSAEDHPGDNLYIHRQCGEQAVHVDCVPNYISAPTHLRPPLQSKSSQLVSNTTQNY